MSMFRTFALVMVMSLSVLAPAGCSSSPSESNFQAAIQRAFDKEGPTCMFTSRYPGHDLTWDFMDINEMSHALAHAGLLTTTVYKQLPPVKASFLSSAMPARTLYKYQLTALGKKYYSTRLKCFAFKRRVVAVTNFTKLGESQYEADFEYKYVVPKWAETSEVVDTAKQIPLYMNYQGYLSAHGKPIKDQADVTLTHNGWRAQLED
jgi:hypothetical protein